MTIKPTTKCKNCGHPYVAHDKHNIKGDLICRYEIVVGKATYRCRCRKFVPDIKETKTHLEDPARQGYYFCNHTVGKGNPQKMTSNFVDVTCLNCRRKLRGTLQ